MKKILIPVDFTVVAFNALKYAYKCFPDAHITVVHIVPPSLNSSELKYSVLDRYMDVNDKMEEEVIGMICNELGCGSLPDRMSVDIVKGEVVNKLKSYISENSFDAIVMGTRDKYDLLDKVIGTVSLALVKTSDCPLYLIPRYASYNGFKKVMVASDQHLLDNEVGTRIKEWNKDHNAFIKFLHINRDNGDDDFSISETKLVNELFEGDQPTFGFEIDSIHAKNISKTLLESAYGFGADLLVGMPDKQNFITSLIYKSITKDLIQKSDIPLLFIHPLESII